MSLAHAVLSFGELRLVVDNTKRTVIAPKDRYPEEQVEEELNALEIERDELIARADRIMSDGRCTPKTRVKRVTEILDRIEQIDQDILFWESVPTK